MMTKPNKIQIKVNGKVWDIDSLEIPKSLFDSIYNEMVYAGMAYDDTRKIGPFSFDTEKLTGVRAFSAVDVITGEPVVFLQSPGKTTAHFTEESVFDVAAEKAEFRFYQIKRVKGFDPVVEVISYKLKTGDFGRVKRTLKKENAKKVNAEQAVEKAKKALEDLKTLKTECLDTYNKIKTLTEELDVDFGGKGKGLRAQLADAKAAVATAESNKNTIDPLYTAYTTAVGERETIEKDIQKKEEEVKNAFLAANPTIRDIVRTDLENAYRTANPTLEADYRAAHGTEVRDAVVIELPGADPATIDAEVDRRITAIIDKQVRSAVTEAAIDAEVTSRVKAHVSTDPTIVALTAALPTKQTEEATARTNLVAGFAGVGVVVAADAAADVLEAEYNKLGTAITDARAIVGDATSGLTKEVAEREAELTTAETHRDNVLIPKGKVAQKYFTTGDHTLFDKEITKAENKVNVCQGKLDAITNAKKTGTLDVAQANYDAEHGKVQGLVDKLGLPFTSPKNPALINRLKGLDPILDMHEIKLEGGKLATVVTMTPLAGKGFAHVLVEKPIADVAGMLYSDNTEIVKDGHAIKIVNFSSDISTGNIEVYNSTEFDPVMKDYKDSSTNKIPLENPADAKATFEDIAENEINEEGKSTPVTNVIHVEKAKKGAAKVVASVGKAFAKVGGFVKKHALAIGLVTVGVLGAWGATTVVAVNQIEDETQSAYKINLKNGHEDGKKIQNLAVVQDGKARLDLVKNIVVEGYGKANYQQQDWKFFPFFHTLGAQQYFNNKFGYETTSKHAYTEGLVSEMTTAYINNGFLPAVYDDNAKLVVSDEYVADWTLLLGGEKQYVITGAMEAISNAKESGVKVTSQDYTMDEVMTALTEKTGLTYTEVQVNNGPDGEAGTNDDIVFGVQENYNAVTVCFLNGDGNTPITQRIAEGEIKNAPNGSAVIVNAKGESIFGNALDNYYFVEGLEAYPNVEHVKRQSYVVRDNEGGFEYRDGAWIQHNGNGVEENIIYSVASVKASEGRRLKISLTSAFGDNVEDYTVYSVSPQAHDDSQDLNR